MGASDIILICLTVFSAVNGIIIAIKAYRAAEKYVKDQILPFDVNVFFGGVSPKKVQIGRTTKVKVTLMDQKTKDFSDSEDKNCQPSFF